MSAVIDRRAAKLRNQIEALASELTKLENRPDEPLSGGLATIVYIRNSFDLESDKMYDYAAIRTDNAWYLTGNNSRQRFTWTEMLDWLDRTGPLCEIYLVTDFRGLTSPVGDEENAEMERMRTMNRDLREAVNESNDRF